MNKLLVLFSSLFLLISCSYSNLLSDDDSNVPFPAIQTRSEKASSMLDGSFLSREEAIHVFESYDHKTHSIKTVDYKDQHGYYEIEFSSDKMDGYAIIPADSRIDKPICFVEHGSLEDTLEIEPLKHYFRRIPQYLSYRSKVLDSLLSEDNRTRIRTRSAPEINEGNSTLVRTYYVFSSDTISRKVLVQWGQCPPLGSYINYCYSYCSVPAVAQVMSYHKKDYCGYTESDWNDMILGLNDDAIADIGLNVFNDIHWFFNTIAPLPQHIVSFLNDNNYSASSSCGYSFSTIKSYLQSGPAILLGFDQDPVFHPDSGHYWVVDAAAENITLPIYVYEYVNGRYIYEYEVEGDPICNEDVYFNWGWGASGSSNGWYDSGVFQPLNSTYNFSNSIRLIKVEP